MSGAVLVLVIGFANPEAWVAERNIERYHATGKIDTYYLSGLSADAVPTIVAGLPEELAACATWHREGSADDLLAWNLGRARAAEVGGGVTGQPSDCP